MKKSFLDMEKAFLIYGKIVREFGKSVLDIESVSRI